MVPSLSGLKTRPEQIDKEPALTLCARGQPGVVLLNYIVYCRIAHSPCLATA